jgi:hypothetical protein
MNTATPVSEEWTKVSRRPPAAYRLLSVRTTSGREVWGLTWSAHDETFIEPITGQPAQPLIGIITHWRYET